MSSTRVIRFCVPPVSVALLTPEREKERAERDRACEAAYRRGFDEASEFLNRQILEQRSDLAHLQSETLRQLAEQAKALTQQVSAALPHLVVDAVGKVLAGFEPDRETVCRIAEETLSELAAGTSDVEVRLCPRDFELSRGLDEQFEHRHPGVRMVADAGLQPGDCRVLSRFGEIDGRLATKLANIGRSLA